MRAFLASAVGVACTAALALPLTNGQGAAAAPGAAPRSAPASAALPGSTQSLPLAPLTPSTPGPDRANVGPEYGVKARTVRPFSLVGVVWDDARAELHGRVQVRTRATGTERWSRWQDVEVHGDHAPDLDAAGRHGRGVRGSTAPLWVGDSDGVQLRVRPEPLPAPGSANPPPTAPRRTATSAPGSVRAAGRPAARAGARSAAGRLPSGLRLELVHPGDPVPAPTGHDPDAAVGPDGPDAPDLHEAPAHEATAQQPAAAQEPDPAPDADPQPQPPEDPEGVDDPAPTDGTEGQSPAEEQLPAGEQPSAEETTDALVLDQNRSVAADLVLPAETMEQAEAQRTWQRRYTAPRPRIVLRRGWSADERLRERRLGYTKTVKAAFVHHSATGNNYRCSQAPSVIRSIYRYHVKSSGWRDLGYNFLVDRCGNIYEGRAGGPSKPVLGAHTLGFNSNSTGIAVLGTYSRSRPPRAAVRAVAKLTAWKLGLHGRNPLGSTYLVSGGSNKYRKGVTVRLRVISGHRDGFTTDCPGTQLYLRLGAARSTAAQLQGR